MTSDLPRVSIIITSYNQRDHLVEAIESVMSQTLRPHEIIIADDHSTEDDSVAVIRGYAARHPGWIKAIYQPQNVGIPANRNSALHQIEGDYVGILDGDDRLLPQNLERHMAALAAHPETGCSYSNIYLITPDGRRYSIRDCAPQPAGNILAEVAAFMPGMLRSLIGRSNLICAAGYMDVNHPNLDGYVLTLRLAAVTQFVYVLEPLMEKRSDPGSVSSQLTSRERAADLDGAYAEAMKFIGQLTEDQARRVQEIWFWNLLNAHISADIEGGQRLQALARVARGLATRPRRLRRFWKLARQVLA